ncbi:MAG: DUF1109 domain-containing protein [Betaproteobacteria bacterium]|nr:DUF1109 domain-containing protein [Betaproteobacteria bacterium]
MVNIEELVESLAEGAATVQPAPHPFVLAAKWLAVAAAYVGVSLAISGLRPGLMAAVGDPWFLAEIILLAGILAATSLSAALLAFPDLHQKRRAAFSPAVILVLFALIVIFSWQADSPPAPLPEHSYQCTVSIALFALLPAVWMIYGMRKFASTHYRLAGSIALLYAFSIGALWLRLHEQNDSLLHVIQWHYLPMIGFGILGLWLGKVLLKW